MLGGQINTRLIAAQAVVIPDLNDHSSYVVCSCSTPPFCSYCCLKSCRSCWVCFCNEMLDEMYGGIFIHQGQSNYNRDLTERG